MEKEKNYTKKVDMEKTGLKQISCDPDCGFLVRSHDEGEVEKFAIDHMKQVHHTDLTEKDAQAKIESA